MVGPVKFIRSVGRHFRSRIFSGLLVVLPLGATYLVLKFVFDLVDPGLRDLVEKVFNRDIPGAGIVIFLIIVYVVGIIASYVIGRRLIALGHRIADLIPIVRPIYRTTRQTLDALKATNLEHRFSRVVLLDYPKEGIKTIGLVTASYKDGKGTPMVVVYVPNTPIPTSGFLAMLPEDKVFSISLTVDEAMRIVISGGVLTPPVIYENSWEGVAHQEKAGEAPKEASNH